MLTSIVAKLAIPSKIAKINITSTKVRTNNMEQYSNNIAQHLVLDLLHRLELFYEKQQTSKRNEIRVIA
jgi:hypothetical protein